MWRTLSDYRLVEGCIFRNKIEIPKLIAQCLMNMLRERYSKMTHISNARRTPPSSFCEPLNSKSSDFCMGT